MDFKVYISNENLVVYSYSLNGGEFSAPISSGSYVFSYTGETPPNIDILGVSAYIAVLNLSCAYYENNYYCQDNLKLMQCQFVTNSIKDCIFSQTALSEQQQQAVMINISDNPKCSDYSCPTIDLG